MKYLKISSLLVLSLLLLAAPAMAQVTCELQPGIDRLRAESEYEMLSRVDVLCEWTGGNDIVAANLATTGVFAANDVFDTFSLTLELSADIVNVDDTDVTLWLDDAAVNAATVSYRTGVDVGDISGDEVTWENIPFPLNWDVNTAAASGMFGIAGIHLDATGGDDELLGRLRMTAGLASTAAGTATAAGLTGNVALRSERNREHLASIDQALELALSDSQKVVTFKSCPPEETAINVDIGEGNRMAWEMNNDIALMVSSGTIKLDETNEDGKGVLKLTDDGDSGELVFSVVNTPTGNSVEKLKVKIQPAAGDIGDKVMLSVMFVPEKRTDESFVTSATIDVGVLAKCEGEGLVFPFLSNKSGFDTGVALINNSDVDGECVLSWDGKVEEEYEDVDERDKMDVDAKKQTVFILSVANPGFQGLLSVACEFTSAYGYAFITDTVSGSGAQGYVAR